MVGLCRLCASLRKMDTLVSIMDESSDICEKVRKCCALHIKIEDALPKCVCQECIENLNNSYKFYIKVKEAQETLQSLYPILNKNENSAEENSSEVLDTYLPEPPKEFVEQFHADDVESWRTKTEVVQTVSNILGMAAEETIKDKYVHFRGNEKKNYLNDTSAYEQKEEILEECTIVEHNNDESQFIVLNGDDGDAGELNSDDVLKQLDDLISENGRVHLEVECMESYEEEEEGEITINVEQYVDNDGETEPLSSLPIYTKIKSWKNYKYLCFICNDIFVNFIQLKDHIKHEHNIFEMDKILYKCYDCKKVITRYNLFLNHIRSKHHSNLKLRCDVCDLCCQNFKELSHHRTVDCVEAKNYAYTVPCNQCFKSFHSVCGLQNHYKLQHDSSKTKVKYKCIQCKKEFQYKSCLKSHEQLHTDKKRFSCIYCDRSFYNKLSLEQHLYVHVDEKTYQCNICCKRYKTYQILAEHQKLHTNVKPFKCQFCDKCFSQKVQKLAHERSHTGEMPYACQQCDKRFRYRSALNAHSKIHTGDKPYSCGYCEKTFADSSNRNKHAKRMHSNDERKENI